MTDLKTQSIRELKAAYNSYLDRPDAQCCHTLLKAVTKAVLVEELPQRPKDDWVSAYSACAKYKTLNNRILYGIPHALPDEEGKIWKREKIYTNQNALYINVPRFVEYIKKNEDFLSPRVRNAFKKLNYWGY